MKKRPGPRPNCPNCGHDDVVSNGVKWMCNGCGKQWVKIRLFPLSPRLDPNRPDCPLCGAKGPISQGMKWVCTSCGRSWTKMSPLKLYRASVCGAPRQSKNRRSIL